MFDSIYALLGLDVFQATNMSEFFPLFLRFLVALAFLTTAINVIFGAFKTLVRGVSRL